MNFLKKTKGLFLLIRIISLGCFHSHLKKFGFNAQMWDRLGACLLDGLVVQVNIDLIFGYIIALIKF